MFDKLKQLTTQTALYGVSTIVGRFLNFLLVPFYTNTIPLEQFGIYTYLYSIIAFVNIVYIYGMDAAFMKYSSAIEKERKKTAFTTPMLAVTVTSVLFSLIIAAVKMPISNLMDLPGVYTHLIYYVAGILVLDTLSLIPFAHLRLENKAARFAGIRLINIAVNIFLNVYLIVFLKWGIEAIFVSNMAASAVSLLLLLPDILKNITLNLDYKLFRRMFKFGIFFLPASLTATMVQMIDVPIMQKISGYDSVGLYRANYKLGIFMMLIVSMFNYAWQPFFLTNAKEKNAKEIFAKVLTLFTLVCASVWLVLTVFMDNIVHFELWDGKTLIGHDYVSGFYIVPVVLMGYVFHGMYHNFTAGLYIEEKTKYFPYVTFLGAFVNVVVNLIMIPLYGIMGAAIATLASYFVMAVGLFLAQNSVYKINYEWRKLAIILGTIVVELVLYYRFLTEDGLPIHYKLLFLASFVFVLFVFKVVSVTEVKFLITKLARRK